jgi:hypothetical protein
MTDSRIVVSGPLSSITTLHRQMAAGKLDGVELTGIAEKPRDPLDPKPLGLEPLTYFVVVFTGHLAASFVHQWINVMISKGGHDKVSTDEEAPTDEE